MLTFDIVSVINLIATGKLSGLYYLKKHNIESKSQGDVVIRKLSGKIKMTNRALFTLSAKHLTRKRELNKKLEKLICNINT